MRALSTTSPALAVCHLFFLIVETFYLFLFVIFLTVAFPVGEVIAHCDFSLCFPDDYDIGHLFICLLDSWMTYLEKRLSGSLPVH